MNLVFVAKSKSPEEWKAVASAISTLVDEATFEAAAEGISFRGMDPSHIALIDIHWPNHAFEKYECDSLVKFGIRVDEFSKLIRRADKKDAVEISIGDDSMLHLKMSNSYKREYKSRLIESSASSTPLPKLNFNSKAVFTATAFDKVLSDVQVVSEYISIESKSGSITLSGRGDSGEADITLEAGNEGLEELEAKEESKATYSIDYLSKITKAVVSMGGSVTAEYSSKMPLRLEFKIANVGRIHFYLAPRVQD
ncbi:MAG: proliferating cell nuclear antigen (pcna) [Thermoproteota archaeon]|jgi:proliferating cell nuclear antigen|nr:proliferating cell nuclear antigen (pcna) [Thermoproteota archaeon]MDQ3562348.1 proliferating cell nuclear antigen (pcna) [Thermoproteota archaeon]MDQ5876420.1 proliferating cell nuclear antigen (pcna) [Thermoproteota archaeon]